MKDPAVHHTRILRFAAICVAAYVAISWTVRYDLRFGRQIASIVYPFDTFSMYATMPPRDIGHLLVRDRSGVVHRVTEFSAYECKAPVSGDSTECSDRQSIPYHFEKLLRHVEEHPGSGSEDVDLIIRSWRLEAGKAARHSGDCVISRCRVSR